MKLIVFSLTLFVCDFLIAGEQHLKCDFSFEKLSTCQINNVSASLMIKKISIDEIKLEKISVNNRHNKNVLNITKNTYMLENDKGYISFSDINFDGAADISITTSFGLANLYLDYWVYDRTNAQYIFIGNFSQFSLNSQTNVLTNRIKINAQEYSINHYRWQGLKLLKVD